MTSKKKLTEVALPLEAINRVQRAEAAFNAGCDMALICNKPQAADTVE